MTRISSFYIASFALLIAGLCIVLYAGARLEHAPPALPATNPLGIVAAHPVEAHSLVTLFLQIGLILAVSRIAGLIFARFQQPQVMGEMIAGILLGPSLLGWLAPHASAAIFPVASVPYLNVISQVGVIFFLFLVGLELDPKLIRNRGQAAVLISHVSIIAPFLLGAALALHLYNQSYNPEPKVHFTAFALFMGAAMSITAFPVLARILTERNLTRTRIGAVAITCAAVDDVTAWCMLAFVTAVAKLMASPGGASLAPAALTVVYSILYVAAMFLIVRPFLVRLEVVYERHGRLSQNIVSVIFLLILGSSLTTEWIGIHALFGAFLMGAIMPKGTNFIRHLSEKLEDFTVVFLLPVFFAYTGLRTQIGLLNSGALWLDASLIIFVACLGKFGGSALAARASGIGWRESSAIGVLMNTRGLMELVILNLGRDLGVISDAVFAMMVLMAIVTTFLTTPILNWVYPRRLIAEERGALAGAGGGAFSILIPVSLPKSGGPLVQLADTLIGPADGAGKIFALHLRPPADHPTFRSGLVENGTSSDESLAPLLAQARARSLVVEPLSFVSRDISSDISNIARERAADLVLIGFHKPVIGKAILGGTVHHLLSNCPTDLAIFVDRGFRQARKILIPYLGTPHDRLALALAARMARNTDAQVTVLHVVPPMRGDASKTLEAREHVDRAFTDPGQTSPVTFRVVEDPSPVGVVLHQAPQFDLIIIGVAEEWGLESHLFGWRAERIARDCPTSMLIVRKSNRI